MYVLDLKSLGTARHCNIHYNIKSILFTNLNMNNIGHFINKWTIYNLIIQNFVYPHFSFFFFFCLADVKTMREVYLKKIFWEKNQIKIRYTYLFEKKNSV